MSTDRLEERYEAFVRNSSEGIWLAELDEPIPVDLDPLEQVRLIFQHAYMAEANDAMAAMYAMPSADMLIGSRINQLLIEDDPQNIDYLTSFVRSDYNLHGVESHEIDQNGQPKVFRNSLVGVVKDGKLLRAWGTQQDVTEQYIATQALLKSEERLALALKVSGMGLWEWNMVTGDLEWSDELKRLYGMKPTDGITYEKYLHAIHPDDRPATRRTIDGAIESGKEYMVEHRVVWKDGTVHWITGRGKAFYEDGVPIRMVGTAVDVEDTKRKDELEERNRELILQQAELEKINRTKDEFISLASHQLRTPATAVKQYLGIVLEGYVGDISDKQTDALKKAYISNERQLSIINDLLRVAQLDAGKVKLRKTKVELVGFINKIVDDMSDKFKETGQKTRVNSSDRILHVMVDQDRIRMAIENIIENASKYSPPNSEIIIAIVKQDTCVDIKVIDKGVGIRKKDIPRLFQKFARLEDPRTSEVSGTGLGLYWANKIIQLHDGQLGLESTLRKGSTFIVSLPIK